MKLTFASFHAACATDTFMEMPWAVSSGVNMVMAVPSSVEPWRREVPEAKQQASTRVVFPAPPCPTTTTLRMRSVVNEGADAICTSGAGGGKRARGGMPAVPAERGGYADGGEGCRATQGCDSRPS